MLREPLKVEAYTIKEVQGLDPIYVYREDFSLGKGRVTITCYGEAWTAYWGAMGNQEVYGQRQLMVRTDIKTSVLILPKDWLNEQLRQRLSRQLKRAKRVSNMAKLRLCRKCYDYSVRFGLLPIALGAIKHGWWICPFGKKDCGTKKEDEQPKNPESGQVEQQSHHSYRSKGIRHSRAH